MENDIIEEVVELPANESEEEKVGNVKIAVDVVATIAGIAASETEGVAEMNGSLAGGIAEIFGAKKNLSKGVKVDINENDAVIDLYITVDYGIRIPELAWEIQENVKNSVETMTGLNVVKVNVHVEGVSFSKEKAQAAADASASKKNDAEDEIIVEDSIPEDIPESDDL